MSERIWHKGPPPHVGWWNASAYRDDEIWRWWNGEFWSDAIDASSPLTTPFDAASIKSPSFDMNDIYWTTYYPKNARVPRIDPGSTK